VTVVKRPVGYGAILIAVVLAITARYAEQFPLDGEVGGLPTALVASQALSGAAILFASYGLYMLTKHVLVDNAPTKRRGHDVRNVLRLAFGVATLIALLGVLTQQWVGVLFSLGIVGFAVTFALQQPLFSAIGWLYIMVKRPYQVGDRVAIEDSKGDVVEVDFLVTTLWEINGGLVSSNQPSGRIITLPNSVVLSSHVANYTREEFPFVWNELTIQVAYETELDYARGRMVDIADDYLGDEMAARIATYRERLSETPVELEVQDRPTVNVVQQESWVELRLRYLVHPRRGQRVRNELYERILADFNEAPDRVRFPVSRNR
jgi:small-conductance mechanosensitive channel